MNEDTKQWELETNKTRLKSLHKLKILKSNAQKSQLEKKNIVQQKQLSKAMESWVYLNVEKTDAEIAWIIFSQLIWKGNDYQLEEEELWEDIPETDPTRIVALEKLGPEEESLLPSETIHLLHNLLNELEQHGIKIKDKTFSLNWERKKKKHKGAEEDKAQVMATLKEKPLKPSKEKKTKKANKANKAKGKKSSMLSAFFGLF